MILLKVAILSNTQNHVNVCASPRYSSLWLAAAYSLGHGATDQNMIHFLISHSISLYFHTEEGEQAEKEMDIRELNKKRKAICHSTVKGSSVETGPCKMSRP